MPGVYSGRLIFSENGLTKNAPQLTTTYFKSYEQREEAFRKSVFSLIPRKYSGPRLFWKDFANVSLEELNVFTKHPLAFITSNPRDGLAFGTPWQVLRAAALCAREAKRVYRRSAEDIAEEFDMVDLLHQPVRTLSGGETVKLALAKAYVASLYMDKLVIASPFSWLSHENAVFFQKLFDRYDRLAIPVELFALEGEDSDKPVTASEFGNAIKRDPIDFAISLKDLRIPLGSSLNPIYYRQVHARVDDFEERLYSPCLIVGENGRGKSLIAKVLAGAMLYQGHVRCLREEKSGPPRLLFQDVITQTLLRSFDAIAGSTVDTNGFKPVDVYEKILAEYCGYFAAVSDTDPRKNLTGVTGFWSLLEIKAMLVAVRFCGQTSALILDEPDWGLTRTSAIALVAAIIEVAHSFGIPVVLISHKPWWHTVVNSIIQVERTSRTGEEEGLCAFEIRLSCKQH